MKPDLRFFDMIINNYVRKLIVMWFPNRIFVIFSVVSQGKGLF